MESQRKKGIKLWLVALITIIVIGGFGIAAYGLLKDFNPKLAYLSAEAKTFEEQLERMEPYLKDAYEHQENMQSKAFQSNGELTTEFSLGGEQMTQMLPMMSMIQGIVANSSITTSLQVNPEQSKVFGEFDVNMQGTSLLGAKVYQDETISGVYAPFMYDQYLTLENSRLGEFLEETGEVNPEINEIPNFTKYLSTGMTVDEAKELTLEYSKTMADQLTDEQFIMEKGVEYKGHSYDEVTVTLTGEEARNVISSLVEKMKNDERISVLFQSQLVGSGAELDLVIEEIDNIEIPNGMVLKAYLDKGYVAHRTVSVDIAAEGETVTIQLDTSYLKDGDKYTSTFDLNVGPQLGEGSAAINYQAVGEPTDKGLHVDYDMALSFSDDFTNFSAGATLATDYYNTGSETAFDLTFEGSDMPAEIPVISGFLNTSLEKDEVLTTSNSELGITIDMNDPTTGNIILDVLLRYKEDVEFTNDLEFPSLEAQAVNLLELSEEERNQLIHEMESNMNQLTQGLEMFGGF
ncbi:DUF6583 family protein [Bacillaceae bacterium S4-13-58]